MKASPSTHKIIDVVVAITLKDRLVLITRRPHDVHLPSIWEFPGGKPENGESDEDALKREVREETGLEIRPLRLFHRTSHSYPERTIDIRFYLCEQLIPAQQAKPIQVTAVRWVSISDLKDLEFPEANNTVLKMLGDQLA